jgi:GNAT superfamily N-acetyltransferase
MGIQRVMADQARQLRALRLRALHMDPDAFGSTRARELGLPEDHWQRWAADSEVGEHRVVFIASLPEWAGMAAGFLDADRPGFASLGAMWVDPAVRDRGLGRQLLEAILDWALSRGAVVLELSVMDSNATAERLYSRAGFTKTGVREQLDSERALTMSFMTRAL